MGTSCVPAGTAASSAFGPSVSMRRDPEPQTRLPTGTCTHANTHVRMCTCMHMHAHRHTYEHACTRVCTHEHTHAQGALHTGGHTRARAHTHTCACTRVRAHTNTYTRLCAHTCTCMRTQAHMNMHAHAHANMHTPPRCIAHRCTRMCVHMHTRVRAHTVPVSVVGRNPFPVASRKAGARGGLWASRESRVSFPGNYPYLVQSNEPRGDQTERSEELLDVSSQLTQAEALIDPPGGGCVCVRVHARMCVALPFSLLPCHRLFCPTSKQC